MSLVKLEIWGRAQRGSTWCRKWLGGTFMRLKFFW